MMLPFNGYEQWRHEQQIFMAQGKPQQLLHALLKRINIVIS